MAAPGGTCESCNTPLKWCFAKGFLYVRCPVCTDLFAEDLGMDPARELHETGTRRETENGAYSNR